MSYWKLPIVVLSEMVSSHADSTNGHIAAYVLGHQQELRSESIRSLAAKMNVSPSSVSRFCREIGLEDFNELKALASAYQPPFEQTSKQLSPERTKDGYIRAVCDSLERVRASLDMSKIDRLCRDIRRYERVATFGVMKSESVSINLQADLALLGKPVVTKLPFSEQIDYLEHADENDLIIIFSYRGVYFDYGFPLKTYRKNARGPRIYFITANPGAVDAGLFYEVIGFDSRLDRASHPYQLECAAGLIAERYAQLVRTPEKE